MDTFFGLRRFLFFRSMRKNPARIYLNEDVALGPFIESSEGDVITAHDGEQIEWND